MLAPLSSMEMDSDDSQDDGIRSHRSTVTSFSSLLSHETNYDMLLERLGSPLNSSFGMPATPTPFVATAKPSKPASPTPPPSTATSLDFHPPAEVDWEFWSTVVSDLSHVKRTATFTQQIRYGIPPSIRGTIWQLLAEQQMDLLTASSDRFWTSKKKKKDPLDDVDYVQLMDQATIFDLALAKDLDGLFHEPRYQVYQDQFWQPLLQLLKAYANFDLPVGYAKGFAHLALPLLLQMPEEEAFRLLRNLMEGYAFKTFLVPPLSGLGCFLYQWDHLCKLHLPELHDHWCLVGLVPHDYINPWITTVFAARLPLDNVYRIYDVLLSEGTDMLFGFCAALLSRNQHTLLCLQDKEETLQFLFGDHMDIYENDPDAMMHDSLGFQVDAKQLQKWAKEYHASVRKGTVPSVSLSLNGQHEASEAGALRTVRQQNKALVEAVRHIQSKLDRLTKHTAQTTQALADAKASLQVSHQENAALRQQTFDLKKALDHLPATLEKRIRHQIHTLAAENMALVDKNSDMDQQLHHLETTFSDSKTKFAQSENERHDLSQRLGELRDIVNS
ncbi:RabGAP/TBC [Hesseltinella vesiculosa]|uniref:RabGAP/TBC n=1 Tax=Hesseltinella vesiculosa TaxID=101127 RepID=A0A1X2GGU0_9FUNG|nr:RabGAP/TBC [Hesseltinella vesiculosa]